MNLTDQINSDIKDAMKARDKDKLSTLRSIKSALIVEATKGGDSEMTDEIGIQIINKLYKQRMESASVFNSQGREDLAVTEEAEAVILKTYLPEQMSEADIKKEVESIISQTGASSMKDMGKVMGMASKKMAGIADGKIISSFVKELLS
ncbi:MAG: hypothetical protein ACI8XB_000115 [Patiriisocius sp.]|jgi:uncharacterized protein YqeY